MTSKWQGCLDVAFVDKFKESSSDYGKVYLIQLYVIKSVSDLQVVSDFLWVLLHI
jgi:hypothetical protein